MSEVFRLFRFLPLVAGLILALSFLLRCRMGWVARSVWCVFLFAALLMFEGFAAPDISAAFSSATNDAFRVLLRHRPDSALENLARHDLDLQLSGHTHGGFMPGLWHLTAGCNRGFLRGNYSFGRGHLVVSSGCGPWPAFPFRYFTPSEIVLVRLAATSAVGGRPD